MDFNQKQIELLKGKYSIIANSCGVTREYVKLVLTGKRGQNSKKAKEIISKSISISEILTR